MKYKVVEAKLKTNKSRKYLWKKINTPKKISKIEGFNNAKIKNISVNNYEIISKKYNVVVTFIPEKGVNLVFTGVLNFPLTWFEISGEKNCTISHGEYKRMDSGMSKANLKKELAWIHEHFLEELREIAE
ncbi:hypothetical protein ACFL1H_04750 [Nanoarchaeota archaeon]